MAIVHSASTCPGMCRTYLMIDGRDGCWRGRLPSIMTADGNTWYQCSLIIGQDLPVSALSELSDNLIIHQRPCIPDICEGALRAPCVCFEPTRNICPPPPPPFPLPPPSSYLVLVSLRSSISRTSAGFEPTRKICLPPPPPLPAPPSLVLPRSGQSTQFNLPHISWLRAYQEDLSPPPPSGSPLPRRISFWSVYAVCSPAHQLALDDSPLASRALLLLQWCASILLSTGAE